MFDFATPFEIVNVTIICNGNVVTIARASYDMNGIISDKSGIMKKEVVN